MGSEISTLVGQYLRSEEFPHNLQRKVIRKFGKSVKGSEKEVLASLQAGDPSDPGRNEVKILSRLPPHVQRSAFLFLYEGALRQCSLVRAVSEAGCPEEECFQAFVEACSAFARHSVGAGTVVVAPSQDLDFLLVVRRGELVLRSPDLAGGATTLPAGACIEVGIRRPDLVFAGQQPPLQRANCTARAGQNGAIYSLATRAGVQAALRARPAAERAFLALRTSQIEAQRAQESEHERLVEAKREDERRRQQESLNERLIQAVDRGDVRAVRDLVLQGGEVNAVSDRVSGPLPLFARRSRLAVTRGSPPCSDGHHRAVCGVPGPAPHARREASRSRRRRQQAVRPRPAHAPACRQRRGVAARCLAAVRPRRRRISRRRRRAQPSSLSGRSGPRGGAARAGGGGEGEREGGRP